MRRITGACGNAQTFYKLLLCAAIAGGCLQCPFPDLSANHRCSCATSQTHLRAGEILLVKFLSRRPSTRYLLTPIESERRTDMERQSEQPFESIESTYDFFRLLSDAVAEAKCELEGHIQRESSSKSSRRLDALRISAYSLQKLELHISHSRRILNDLRSLRRLLFEERAASKAAIASKPVAPPAPEIPATSLHVVTAQVARVRGKNGDVVAA